MSETYKAVGRVKLVEETQTFKSGFSKRVFVVEIQDGNYNQMVPFECVQEKIGLLNDVRAGDEVEVFFNLNGREYNSRYYVNLVCWRLTVLSKRDGGGSRTVAPWEAEDPEEEAF